MSDDLSEKKLATQDEPTKIEPIKTEGLLQRAREVVSGLSDILINVKTRIQNIKTKFSRSHQTSDPMATPNEQSDQPKNHTRP